MRQGNTVVGVILPATARDGYSGDIRALVGVRRDGSVAGVRVVAHRETRAGRQSRPAQIRVDLDFNERSLANPALSGWNVAKEGGVRSIYWCNSDPGP